MRIAFRSVSLLFTAIAAVQASEISGVPEKADYNLFNPVPVGLLRELHTDRPDKTESPYTVDAGHVQFEMDLISYSHDEERGGGNNIHSDSLSVLPVNVRIGALNNLDLGLIVEPYNASHINNHTAGTVENDSGFGDITGRVKINFWGNDGGETAFAVMPFVKFPTHSGDLGNNAVEGGIIFPFAAGLPGGWDLGAMTEFDFQRNTSDSGYHATFINSITFGHDILGNLAGYSEFYSEAAANDRKWIGTVDFGLTYELATNLQLDTGVNIGITESADDVETFAGLTWRY